jgi:hypothetical protein
LNHPKLLELKLLSGYKFDEKLIRNTLAELLRDFNVVQVKTEVSLKVTLIQKQERMKRVRLTARRVIADKTCSAENHLG